MQVGEIRYDLSPPEGFEPVPGVYHAGRQVLKRRRYAPGKLVPVKDPVTGRERYHMKDGQATKMMTQREPDVEVEEMGYLAPLGASGNTEFVKFVPPTPEERAAREREMRKSPEALLEQMERMQREIESLRQERAEANATLSAIGLDAQAARDLEAMADEVPEDDDGPLTLPPAGYRGRRRQG